MEKWSHQEPDKHERKYEVVIDERNGDIKAKIGSLPTRGTSLVLGLIVGYALAIIQLGTFLTIACLLKK